MKLVLIAVLLFSFLGWSADFLNVGSTPNQLLTYQDKIIVINSGFRQIPSLSVIDPQTSEVETFDLPENTNPYRGVVDGDLLYLTFNMTDEVVSLNLQKLVEQKIVDFQIGFQPSLSTTGAESVLVNQGLLWVAFTNMQADYSFGIGDLFLFDPTDIAKGPTQKFKLKNVNPKYLLNLNNQQVAIATGEYGVEDGAIVIIDPAHLPARSESVEISTSNEFVQIIKTGGTPGTLVQDGSNLYACDLENSEKGRLFSIDLENKSVTPFELPFKVCSGLVVGEKYLYAAHLNGGTPESIKEHLFVLDKLTKKEVCRLELLPKGHHSPSSVFVSDLKLIKNHLYASLSLARRVVKLELNDQGLPTDCF